MDDYEALVDAMADREALLRAYSAFLDKLFSLPLWSIGDPQLGRIPWRLAREARNHMPETFAARGLYLLGAREIPRYVGITMAQFQERLRRYLWGDDSQCQLAEEYADFIIEHGVEGFPQELSEQVMDDYDTLVRLEGAVDFARHGIADIWVALVPAPAGSSQHIQALERCLIPVASRWNLERGLPKLVNKRHNL